MILLGVDEAIDSHRSVFAKSFDEVENYDANTLVIVGFKREDLQKYNADTLFGVKVNSLLEFTLLINTNAKYAICFKDLAPTLQKCADSYLTDIKVVAMIEEESELEWIAENEIDGAMLV